MKKKTLIFGLVFCIMAISLFLITNYDNRSYKKDEKNEATYKTELALILIDGYGDEATETTLNEVPDASTHYLDFAKSYCVNGSIIGWDSVNNKVKITASKADKCKLYYRAGTAVNIKEDILAKNTLIKTTPDFSDGTLIGEYGLYEAEDDLGVSYYFRGDVSTNYVKFGKYEKELKKVVGPRPEGYGNIDYDTLEVCQSTSSDSSSCAEHTYASINERMYWRIVRINGDGTIRLIYDGESAVLNADSHESIVGMSKFSKSGCCDNYEYVRYTQIANGTETDSVVKKAVDKWYLDNIKNNYGKYIADGVFCNDQSINEEDYTIYDRFASYKRIYDFKPNLKCQSYKDKYTVFSNAGNKLLTSPIGLITADEVLMSGALTNNMKSDINVEEYDNYLTSDNSYWTMSPGWNDGGDVTMLVGDSDNFVAFSRYVNGSSGIRPVINLNADLLFTGSGTIDDPYVVAGFEE